MWRGEVRHVAPAEPRVRKWGVGNTFSPRITPYRNVGSGGVKRESIVPRVAPPHLPFEEASLARPTRLRGVIPPKCTTA